MSTLLKQEIPHGGGMGTLVDHLAKIPSVATTAAPRRGIDSGWKEFTYIEPPRKTGGRSREAIGWIWWVSFSIDFEHPLAIDAIQSLGHVLNSLAAFDPLPTKFGPVSPSPHRNPASRDLLRWKIECDEAKMAPQEVAHILKRHQPAPIDDVEQWPAASDIAMPIVTHLLRHQL